MIKTQNFAPISTIQDGGNEPIVDFWMVGRSSHATTSAAPNFPNSYPIQIVGSKLYAFQFSKNLITLPFRNNRHKTISTSNGITLTWNNDTGTIIANGTATANLYQTITYLTDLPFEPGLSYTLSGCPDGGGGTTYQLYINGLRAGDYTGRSTNTSTTPSTFTILKKVSLTLALAIYKGQVCDNLTFKPQLTLSSQYGSYTPYQNFNPNILPPAMSQQEVTISGMTFSKSNGNSVVLNGTSTATASLPLVRFWAPAGVYRFDCGAFAETDNLYCVRISNTASPATVIDTNYGYPRLFTNPTDQYLQYTIEVIGANKTANNVRITPTCRCVNMYNFELTDVNDNPLYLRQGDRLYKRNDIWYYTQNMGSVTFDGTETWTQSTVTSPVGIENTIYTTNIEGKRPGITNMLCNYGATGGIYGDNGIFGYANNSNVSLPSAGKTTVTEWKTYLGTFDPKIEVIYGLNTSITVEVNSKLKYILDGLATVYRGNYNFYLWGADYTFGVNTLGVQPYPTVTGTYATYDDTEYFEDIHLSDKSTVSQYVTKVNRGDIENAHTFVAGQDFENKQLNAKTLNYLFEQMDIIQNSKDDTFKQDKIEVADTAPTGLKSGQIYFKT